MRRLGRWVLVFAAAAGGCGFARPYARDPLLRDGRGLRGDPTAAREARPVETPEPVPPPAPPGESDLIVWLKE